MNKKGLPVWKLFLLCIYYSPWKHTSIFIYSSWQLSMEHFSLAICDFQTTFLKTRIKATEVCLLATSAGHLKYWRYGKTRLFRVKLNFTPKNSWIFPRNILKKKNKKNKGSNIGSCPQVPVVASVHNTHFTNIGHYKTGYTVNIEPVPLCCCIYTRTDIEMG